MVPRQQPGPQVVRPDGSKAKKGGENDRNGTQCNYGPTSNLPTMIRFTSGIKSN